MRTPRVLHTAAFRLALLYACLFALGAAVLVAFFDASISAYTDRALDRGLVDEARLLLASGKDSAGVARLVGERQAVLGSREFLYRVEARAGRPLAGQLPPGPPRAEWGTVMVTAPQETREYDGETAEVRTFAVALRDGGRLVVGRTTYGSHELRETMMTATLAAAALITVMSLGVAFLIGRLFLWRIDKVSAAAARIMQGRLDERLPAIGMGAEFDRLAANLNAMLDRMQQLMDGLRQVSSDIAHDLRTPLTRLRRRLDEALQAGDADPTRSELAREALTHIDEILATFGALLRIAQVEGGAGRDGFRPVDLSALVERIRQAYEPAAEDEGRTLAANIQPGVAVAGDEELLAQLVSNLIENAFTHAVGSQVIDLELGAEGARACLAVRDRGPGVPQDQREKVLRRFYRLDRSRTTPGAGLGLAMAQAIAQLHGGEIELGDNRPGLVARVSLVRLTERRLEKG